MKNVTVNSRLVVSAAIAWMLAATSTVDAADWPQFLGPNRNGISAETGLIESWPANGVPEVWRVEAGAGMAGLAVQDGTLVTMVQNDSGQIAVALDAATGKTLWQTVVAADYKNQMGDGPRATPTIAGTSVYVHSGDGVLAALKLSDGTLQWSRNPLKMLGGKPADYGMACSPLIVNDQVVVTVGAPKATIVAFDRKQGSIAWQAGQDRTGYSSPALLTIDGKPQVVCFTGNSVLGLQADSGDVLWRYPFETDYDCNIVAPLAINGNVFISSGENHGCALLNIKQSDSKWNVAEVWTSLGNRSVLRNEWQTSILLDGNLYGFDNVGSAGPVTHFACIEAATGKRKWQETRFGKGNLIAADGKLFLTTMEGELVVLRINPDRFQEIGRQQVIESTRQSPALADGKLYLRDDQQIVCLDVRKK